MLLGERKKQVFFFRVELLQEKPLTASKREREPPKQKACDHDWI